VTNTIEYTRQRKWFDPDRTNASVTIVGCGGIGSFAAFALAKLGVQQLTLLDFDIVEPHNIPNQMFRFTDDEYPDGDLGRAKVDGVAWTVAEFAGLPRLHDPTRWCRPICGRLEDGVPLSDVVISALDSMEARAELWKQIRYKAACKLFLDGRLAGENIVLYAVNPILPSDVKGYEATLHSDDEALELSCTARSIIDVGFTIAALITRAVRRHYAEEEVERVVYQNQEQLTIHKGGWS
jgi:hypothetical protein